MMIPIYLCEDEINQLEYLERTVENIISSNQLHMYMAAATQTPMDLIRQMNKRISETALYFLDIELKSRINGIELVAEIRKYDPRAFIVFVTTHEEMMSLTFSYQVEALEYIIKESPLFVDRIKDVLLYVLEKYNAPVETVTDDILIHSGRRTTSICRKDIYYIESVLKSHKIAVHTKQEIIESISTLKEIQERLDERFVQCHKAFIVNSSHILNVDKKNNIVKLDDGSSCPCSGWLSSRLCRMISLQKKSHKESERISKRI